MERVRWWLCEQPVGSTWTTAAIADLAATWPAPPSRDAVQGALDALAREQPTLLTARRDDHRGLITWIIKGVPDEETSVDARDALWRHFRSARDALGRCSVPTAVLYDGQSTPERRERRRAIAAAIRPPRPGTREARVRRLASLGSITYGAVLVDAEQMAQGQAEVDVDAWLHAVRWAVRRSGDDRKLARTRPALPGIDPTFALPWAVVGARVALQMAADAGASATGRWFRDVIAELDRTAVPEHARLGESVDFMTGWWSVPALHARLQQRLQARAPSVRALRCLLETNTVWRTSRRLVGTGAVVHDDERAAGLPSVVFEQCDLALWYGERFGDADMRVRCAKARLLFGTERRWDRIEALTSSADVRVARSAAFMLDCRDRGLAAAGG